MKISMTVCLIAVLIFGVSATKYATANGRKELLEAAIASVNEECAAKEKDTQSSVTNPQKKLHFFKMATAESVAQGNARLKFERMVKRAEHAILERHRQATVQTAEEKVESLAMEVLHKTGSVLTKQEIARIYQESNCSATVPRPKSCKSMAEQRTANGLCNNLRNPTFGAANTPLRRLIAAQYDDGISRLQGTLQIRRVSFVPGPFSAPNPSPRVVSTDVIRDRPVNDTNYSHILMQWGQFLDHELSAIPEFRDPDCLPCAVREDTCVPIPVKIDDEEILRFSDDGRFCHPFSRSLAACNAESPDAVEPRQQINSITHFIDGSNVYQMTDQSSPDGLLNVGLPVPGTTRPSLPCVNEGANPCPEFLAGDSRFNQQTALVTMHTIWLREHNRIAQILRDTIPRGEVVFQITRNIVIAEMQKITYKDYLPIILGDRFLNLIPSYSRYDDTVVPNIPNSFATAAFRFWQSQVQPMFERLDENYRSIPGGPLPLVSSFRDASQFNNNGGTDPILRGLLTQNARQVDEFISTILTNHLFSESAESPGQDLAALDIQRGRDHGLPMYLTWKQWAMERCGVESEFRSETTRMLLLQTYGNRLNDVDLFVGGLAEEPLPGGLVGAVFACIIAKTFIGLRNGDRFYYENPSGIFTPDQRAEIEKTSLSRIICDNSDITEIQPNAFAVKQMRSSCSEIPSVDLSQWENPPKSLPKTCYIRFNTGNSRRRNVYKAISRSLKTHKYHKYYVSGRRVKGMRDDCLSFVCPRSSAETYLIVYAARCPVRTNMNLMSTSRFNNQYRQVLSVGDIQQQNGLYTSYKSCRAGTDTALFFCGRNGGGDEEAEILGDRDDETLPGASAEEDEEVDEVDEDRLRDMLEDEIPSDHVEEIIEEPRATVDENKLIALMEEVLTGLQKQNPSPPDVHKEEKSVQTSSIAELEEAMEELNNVKNSN